MKIGVLHNTRAMLKQGSSNLLSSMVYPDFRWYWAASTVSHITFLIQGVVLGWVTLILTDSALWVGAVAFIYSIPMLIVSPVAGSLADRISRQFVIVVSLGSAALASVALALSAATEAMLPVHILLCSLVLGTAFSMHAPARSAVIPSLVPEHVLFSASAFSYAGTRLVGFFGPILAGVLLDVIGVTGILLLQTVLFTLSAGLYFRATNNLPPTKNQKTKRTHYLQSVSVTVKYLRSNPPLLALMTLALLFVPIGIPYIKLMPVFVRDVLNEGPELLGLMVGFVSLGAALSGITITAVGEHFHKGYAILLACTIFGIGITLFAATSLVWAALVICFIVGICSGIFLTLINAILLAQTPEHLRGRVMSSWGMIWGIVPFTSLLAGAIAEQWGIMVIFVLTGVIIIPYCIYLFVRRSPLLSLE